MVTGLVGYVSAATDPLSIKRRKGELIIDGSSNASNGMAPFVHMVRNDRSVKHDAPAQVPGWRPDDVSVQRKTKLAALMDHAPDDDVASRV